ncbi:(R)-mandelonitrile lyase [Rhodothermus marinus]|uniref:(R)-mandelonitrile lyase n=1 Tax=Rhodothermus marinus TaxID=29549 RepID=UPI0006CF7EFF|nr:carboxymuconolactone decarboxylase family protein [Rhodothermus marinus]
MDRLFVLLILTGAMLANASYGQDAVQVISGVAPVDTAQAQHFTGVARVGGNFQAASPARTYGATVTFEPGARTHWHVHTLGQILVVTAGRGIVQEWNGPAREIRPGDVVVIPPGVKHWHGAFPDTRLTHVALVERPETGAATTWMEAVTDARYAEALAGAAAAAGELRPSRAQQLFGEIAPELAELTDRVLYGRVWADPTLSPRDRSLITVATLIALNRPDQLRSHLALALQNGVSPSELISTIVHLAFYAGWPNAVAALQIAREVLARQ